MSATQSSDDLTGRSGSCPFNKELVEDLNPAVFHLPEGAEFSETNIGALAVAAASSEHEMVATCSIQAGERTYPWRCTEKPAKAWLTGMTSRMLMFTWAGNAATQ